MVPPQPFLVSGLLSSWNLAGPDWLKNQIQIGAWIDGFCGRELGILMLQCFIVNGTA